MRKGIAWCLIVIMIVGMGLPCLAETTSESKTAAFEEEVEKPSTSAADTAGGIATQGILDMIMQFFMAGLMEAGGDFSMLYSELKMTESAALPTFRLEPAYQYIAGKLNSFSGKVEAGYLMFGVDAEYQRIFEKGGAPDFQIVTGHFLLRTLLARVFGANLAIGARYQRGSSNHVGFELGLPLYIYISRHFIFDVQPYWAFVSGHDQYDLGAGLSFKYKMAGVRAGYRAMYAGSSTLHGPRIGLFLQF